MNEENEALNLRVARLTEALNAMLTCFGIDEDEWNHGTMKQARRALSANAQDDQAWLREQTDL